VELPKVEEALEIFWFDYDDNVLEDDRWLQPHVEEIKQPPLRGTPRGKRRTENR
jgi:hypothetical protein